MALVYSNTKNDCPQQTGTILDARLPMIFLLVFGLFNMDKMTVGRVILLDQAQVEESKEIVKAFTEGETFEVIEGIEADDIQGAKQKIIDSEADFAIVIPEEFKNLVQSNANIKEQAAQAQAMMMRGVNYHPLPCS